jgi:hypothetical protein
MNDPARAAAEAIVRRCTLGSVPDPKWMLERDACELIRTAYAPLLTEVEKLRPDVLHAAGCTNDKCSRCRDLRRTYDFLNVPALNLPAEPTDEIAKEQ